MRRILAVDDDSHICLAVRAWLRVAIADGGATGLLALDNSTFDLMIVDIFMPNMRGFRIDQGISPSHANGTADRDFRICLLRPRGVQPRLPENGAQAWCDPLPAQAVQANRIARRNRRVPVGGRSSSQIRRYAGCGCEHRVGSARPNEVIDRLGGVLHEPSRRSDSVCGNRAAQSSSRLADVRHLGKRLQSFYSN